MTRWFRLLLWLYPADFRDEMGNAIVAAYEVRASDARRRRGAAGAALVCLRALLDAAWNGPAERLRPAAIWRRAGQWGRDVTLARRRLVREPFFVAATVATLAVGLGAFAVVYTAVDKILIEPLPYRTPDNLYVVWRDQSAIGGTARDWVSGQAVAQMQRAGGAIESAAGIQIAAPTLSREKDGEPIQITLMPTSNNLLDVLGVSPALGRSFVAAESGPGFKPVVILSHDIWTRLGADPALVGRQVWMSGSAYDVVGVLPSTYRFGRHATAGPPIQADVYVPLRGKLEDAAPAASFGAIIRARPWASPAQVQAAVAAAGRAVDEYYKPKDPVRLYAVGLHEDLVAPIRPVLFALGAAGLFLLVVLTVNLASLLLARTAARERELAVARAIGANGGAIVRSMVAEGLFLGVTGGIAGAIAGLWGTRLLVALAPRDLPRLETLTLDWPTGAVVTAAGALLGIAAAGLPATWAARVSLGSLMASAALRGAASVTPLRRLMIVTQVAVSLVLLCAGALVVRSFERLLAADPGFRSSGVLTFTVAMGPRLFPKPEAAILFQDRLEAALRELPGVLDVSATTALPLSGGGGWSETITLPGAPGNTGNEAHDAPQIDLVPTRPDYQRLMGIATVSGRPFERLRREGVREALIDVRLARDFFPTGSPLGAPLVIGKTRATIVGVVIPARLFALHEDGRPQVYVRGDDWTPYTPSFVIRTGGDPAELAAAVPRAVRQVDPRIAVSQVRTMDEIVDAARAQPRISAVLIAGFAIGALLLVAMGLFGLVSGAVSQRRGELAVRLALGATHGRVLRLVLGEGARLVLIGMLIAGPGIYLAGRVVRSLLIGVTPLDPIALAAAAAGLALVTLAACYLPARRVLSIDASPLLRD